MDMKKKVAALSEIMKKASSEEEGMEKSEPKEMPPRIEDDLLSSEAEKDPSEMAECCPKCGQPMPSHPKHKALLMILAKGKKEEEDEEEDEEEEGSAND